ncbi:Transcriptional regulatory protein MoaR1 [bacterium HR15]|nr:Transcriptional regulatory protein MoaR1 [bacterium HR15]
METPFLAQLRAQERSQLREWLQQVAQGNGGILFITGDWGMGRSSLLRDAVAQAAGLGLVAADTWCRGEHGEPAWMPLASLMEQLLRAFGHDPLAQPLADQLQHWMAFPQSWHIPAQFIRPLRSLARKRALLLCVDDFHLASDALIRLLHGWLAGIRLEPIGLLLTVCTPVERPLLYEFMRKSEEHGVARRLELAPLSLEEARLLIADWEPTLGEDETFVQALHERTRGSPLFMVEILRHAERWKQEWQTRLKLAQAIPTSLRGMVLQRAQSLSARERELLSWLSCFEGLIPIEILPPLLNASERRVAQSLTALLRTGWLEHARGDAHVLAWRNPLVREAIYEVIPAGQRARMHRQIAEQLSASFPAIRMGFSSPVVGGGAGEEEQGLPLPDEQRWLHWMRSEPDEQVLEQLWEAHQQARLRSHPRFRLELLEACLQAATQLNDLPKRIHLLCERPHLMFCLPDGLLRALSASQEAIEELKAHPECDPDRTLWIQVHCARAGQLMQLGRAEESRATLQTLLEQGGWSESQQSMLELTLAYLHACQGELHTAYRLHKAVWQRMRFEREWWQRWAGVLCYTLRYALACGDLALTREVLEQFSEWAAHPAAPPAWKALWHLMQADYAYFEGRGVEQLFHARAVRALEAPDAPLSLGYESEFQTLLYRDPIAALHIADRALEQMRQAIGVEREAEWLLCKAQALLEAERFHDALETLQEARRLSRKLNHQLLLARCHLLHARRMLLAPHEEEGMEQAREHLAQVEPLLSALALPELKVELHRLRSMLLMAANDADSAVEQAQHAVAYADAWGHALYRGLAYLQLAAALTHLPGMTSAGGTTGRDALEHAESLLVEYGAPLEWRRMQQSRPSIEWVSERGWEIEVRMLGAVRVRFRGRELTPDGWVSPRTRALFCHLVLMQERPLHADTLCEQHFPHLEMERARVNLQTTISAVRRSLRRALGEAAGEWLRYDSGFYRWAPARSWAADAFEFERIAREALELADPNAQRERLDEALQVYRGDLLPEFSEEEWCMPHYHRLRALYLECLLARAQLAALMGRHVEVVEYGEQLLQRDPCDEAAARLLMQAYRALGRRADALQVYTRCQKALAELLDATPSEPTRQLYESLLKG